MLICDALDGAVIEQEWGVLCLLHVQLEEGLWAEGRVCGDCNVAALAKIEQVLLNEVWVVLNLEGLWHVLGVTLNIEEQAAVVVGDTNRLDQTLIVELLHGVVGVLERSFAEGELVVLVEEARRISYGWIDILESDWEVNNVEIKVVNAPIRKLLLGNWLDTLLVVEGVPARLTSAHDVKLNLGVCTHSLETKNSSSRFTIPSLMARATPSPASFSLP